MFLYKNLEKNIQNSFINSIGILVDCTAFLLSKNLINLLIRFLRLALLGYQTFFLEISPKFIVYLLIQVIDNIFLKDRLCCGKMGNH